MVRLLCRPAILAGLLIVITGSGCGELFVLFGPGGIFPPEQQGQVGSVGGGTGGTGGTGMGSGGAISTTQPNVIAAPSFTSSQIDPVLEATAGARVIVAADMDGDGLVDFVSGSEENQPIQIHRRITADALEFETFTIAGGGPIARMVDIEVADFDADGNPDVAVLVNDTGFVPVMGATLRGAIVILFAPDDPTDVLSWVEVTIGDTFFLPSDADGMVDFAVADYDNANGPDFMLASNEVNDAKNTYLYRNPGPAQARSGPQWQRTTVNMDVVTISAIEPADIDNDGDVDLVAIHPEAKTFSIRWYVNPLVEAGAGVLAAGNWERRIVGQQSEVNPDNQGGDFMDIADIDGDGDLDVAVAHVGLGLVQWFDNPGPALTGVQTFPWEVFNIGEVMTGAVINQIQLVDLNLDGQVDLFLTASGNFVGMQPGNELRDVWNAFAIAGTNPIAEIGKVAFTDVNGDGLLDFAAPLDRVGLTDDQFLLFVRTSPN